MRNQCCCQKLKRKDDFQNWATEALNENLPHLQALLKELNQLIFSIEIPSSILILDSKVTGCHSTPRTRGLSHWLVGTKGPREVNSTPKTTLLNKRLQMKEKTNKSGLTFTYSHAKNKLGVELIFCLFL